MKFGIVSNGSSDYTVNSDGKLITAKKITKSMCENILDNITNGTTYNIVIGPDVTNTEFRKFMDKMFNTSYNSTGKKVGNNSVLDLSKNTQITQFGLGYSGNIPVDHKFTKIIIPPNLAVTRNNILDLTQNFRNTPSYDVPAECTNFISYDGVLYDKDKTKIMAYPPGKTGTSFTIPFTTVTEIYDYAFNHQKYLTTPPLSGITTIGYSSFTHSVITSLDLQSSIQVADGAFWCCESLTSLTIRNGRTKIEKDMFRQCKKLTSISLPASIEEIGTTAFAYNDKLASINIPANTTKIGNQAFKDCPLLNSVNFANPNGWVRDSTGAAVDFTDDPAENAAIITSLPAIHRE